MSGMLLAGCTSHPSPPDIRASWVPPLLPAAKVAASNESPQVDDKLVRAYAHYAQGMIFDLQDKSDDAQKELSEAALNDPSNEDLVLELSRRYLQQKEPDKALEILNRAVAIPNASGTLYARLGLVYSRLGKEQEAIQACQIAIKRSPKVLDGYRALFFVHLQKGRPKDALKILDQAAHVKDASVEFSIGLVELYGALERQAPSEKTAIDVNALAILNRVSSQDTISPQIRLKLADEYALLGDTASAAHIYKELLDSRVEVPGVRDKLVEIYIHDKQYKQAKEQLDTLVLEDPTNAKNYYFLAQVSEEDKKYAEAANYYQKALVLSDVLDLYYRVAEMQIFANEPKDALSTLERAKSHREYKDGFVPEWLAAQAYGREKDYTNALAHFTSAEVIAKANAPQDLSSGFYFEQGSTYERAGQFEEAEKCFEKCLQLSPDFPEALNYLGYMWADRGVKLDRAKDLIEKALKLEPNSAAYLDSLGWVLYKLNRPQEALPNLQKAIQLSDEPDATLFDHLGDIYAALKEPDKARDAWTRSISVEPNEQVRKKLDEIPAKTGR